MTLKRILSVLTASVLLAGAALAKMGDTLAGTFSFILGNNQATMQVTGTEGANHRATGSIVYHDAKSAFFATVTWMNVQEHVAWVVGRIDRSTNSAFAGKWVFMKIIDGGNDVTANRDRIWVAIGSKAAASGGQFRGKVHGPIRLSSGNVTIN